MGGARHIENHRARRAFMVVTDPRPVPAMLSPTFPHDSPVRVFDADAPQRLARALGDLREGMSRFRLAWALAQNDLRNRYRGSVLGPIWLTLSTAVMLVALGLLYSTLFRLEIREYLPWLAVSLIVWNLIASTVSDSCTCLIQADAVIRQLPLPYSTHALRCVLRNVITAAHNLPLIALVFAIFGVLPGPSVVLVVPGLLLFVVNALACALLLGIICARFRDVVQIVSSLMQIAFFVTPVIWKPELLREWAWVLPLNPFFALMETIRAPLMEGGGSAGIWVAAIGWTALHLAVAFTFFVRFRGRVAFWV